MAEDKYENINMLQMANMGKEVNYDQTKLFSGIPDEEAIKIIKQYFEKKAKQLSKGQYTLIQSRRKWKTRYYKNK